MGPFVWEVAESPIRLIHVFTHYMFNRVKVIGSFVWELPGGKRQQSQFLYSEQRTLH